MRRHTLLYGFLLFLMLTVLLGLAFGGYPQRTSGAYAQGTSAIAGKVTGDGSAPVANVRVVVYQLVDFMNVFSWEEIGRGLTDGNGDYLVAELADGTYRVGFLPPDNPREYFAQYYLGATTVESATDVIVPAGTTVPNISAQLSSGAHIKGRVTDPFGHPLRDIGVSVSGSYFAETVTESDGTYLIRGLTAGDYQVNFSDTREPERYAAEYFDDTREQVDIATLTLMAEQVITDINAQLDLLAVLTGTVVNAQANPVKDVDVAAEKFYDDPEGPYWYADNVGQTDASGTYTITGLQPGIYRVLFEDRWRRYSTQYYENAYNSSAATPLTLTYNSTMTNVNAQLAVGSRITGVVTDMAGQPLTGIRVRAEDYYLDVDRYIWRTIALTETKAGGKYNLCCLSPESYRVSFRDPSQQYLTEYYDDVPYPDVFGPDTVSMIPVTSTKPMTNVNAMLGTYSVISGLVTDEEERPLDDIQVTVERYDLTGGGYWDHQNTVTTGETGQFAIGDLLPGRHRVLFADSRLPQQYRNTIIKESPELDQEEAFRVTASATYTYHIAMTANTQPVTSHQQLLPLIRRP